MKIAEYFERAGRNCDDLKKVTLFANFYAKGPKWCLKKNQVHYNWHELQDDFSFPIWERAFQTYLFSKSPVKYIADNGL